MRSKIQILPDSLINKIAAGEVVERPASVAKELLENALDAGSSRISISVENGGRTLIRISDDGHGIPADEAPLAFAQHATSKIKTPDDLFAIATMGFRGEALASIASVSHATMTTRTRDSEHAVRIEVKDSVLGPVTPCAASVGTSIEVRDLFYSVPARRNFLRTDATEFSHLHEMVLRCALPNPHVAFTLTHNGKRILDLPITADHRMRVAEALGGGGAETRDLYHELIPIDFTDRTVRVRGFAGQPAMARPTARYQYLFLNGRYIRDRSLFHALKEAYRGLIEPASQPVGILFLDMDPALFDVNVHPQKTEVRFRDSGTAYRAVLVALREKLLESDLTPTVKTTGRTDAPAIAPNQQQQELAPATSAETRQVIADFFKQQPPTQPRLHFGVETRPSPLEDPSKITVGSAYQVVATPQAVTAHPTAPSTPMDASNEIENQTASGPRPFENRFVQLHNAYIVAETDEGVVIIDQHALHERILYEELFARATRGTLEGQRLLLPEILPINPRQAAALQTVKPLLTQLGIEVEDFDSGSVAVHTFPSLLSKVSPPEFLRDLLARLMEYGGTGASKLTSEELLHEVLDMASCKAAVKAGYPLSHEEIAALLARKQQVERSSNCPHGRPTTLRLTLSDLERQFKRK
ncbi:MAG TPA: DNA mismatch repair endonuclease MutL [Phycisphaerae bacterium]|nr:DNA mismatch repair endonuclease MutL [Phycisphaerae bacterium]